MDSNITMQPEGSKGSLIGSVIVVLILVIGAIYLYMNRSTTPVTPPVETPAATTENTTPVQSDDTQTLQSDASAVDMTSLDTGVTNLGNDFQQ